MPNDILTEHPSINELVFECNAVGVPKPKILWQWNGNLIEDGKVNNLEKIESVNLTYNLWIKKSMNFYFTRNFRMNSAFMMLHLLMHKTVQVVNLLQSKLIALVS